MDIKINKDNIFCLIGSFLKRLNLETWYIVTDNGIRLNSKSDKLIITDRVKGIITEELSKIYKVEEKL